MPARRARSDSAAVRAEAARLLAAGGVRPPAWVKLTPAELTVFASVTQARLPQDWADIDLGHAANLARTMVAIELCDKRLARARGGRPGDLDLMEVLLRRSIALTRILQLHAKPRGAGLTPTKDTGARKAEALNANRAMAQSADDDLIARPGRLQ